MLVHRHAGDRVGAAPPKISRPHQGAAAGVELRNIAIGGAPAVGFLEARLVGGESGPRVPGHVCASVTVDRNHVDGARKVRGVIKTVSSGAQLGNKAAIRGARTLEGGRNHRNSRWDGEAGDIRRSGTIDSEREW